MTNKTDLGACRELLRGGSRSFFAASLVLPRSLREPATALYAFCRLADDAVDLGGDRHAALAGLHQRLNRAYAGSPCDTAADRAFAQTVASHSIPKELPRALLEGFAWDADDRRYETIEELCDYAARVAGTVGAMMAMIMGARSTDQLARACDLGIAMQLTNIARDVGEDAAAGRIYLPLQWLRDEGIEVDHWLEKPAFSVALARVVRRLLAHADELYRRADAGIARLPASCRPAMFAARLLYAEIGNELIRRGLNSVDERCVVAWRRKARLLTEAMIAATRSQAGCDEPAHRSAQFLVDAALQAVTGALAHARSDAGVDLASDRAVLPEESPRERARWPRIGDRVVWLVDLFERLERRELAFASAGAAASAASP